MEGAYAIKNGNLVSFSEQQLVDCSVSNDGCNGGLMDYAFTYAETHFMEKESDYTYTGRDGTCQYSQPKGVAEVSTYKDIKHNSDESLMDALQNGPVSIAIDAEGIAFQMYRKGIIKRFCGDSLDHGVLVVGYGSEANGGEYYIVKNSWGSSWGEDGYVLLGAHNKGKTGTCGCLQEPSMPFFL